MLDSGKKSFVYQNTDQEEHAHLQHSPAQENSDE